MKVPYGQNFLINKKLIYKFVSFVNQYFEYKSLIVEIGVGKGQLYFQFTNPVVGYEIDLRLKKYLEKAIIVYKDFLKSNIKSRYYVGNLPYYCAKKIIYKILNTEEFEKGIFIVGDYLYNILRKEFNVKSLEKISNTSFKPLTKIKSRIILIVKGPKTFEPLFKN